VPEQNRFAALENALAKQIHQRPERAAHIDQFEVSGQKAEIRS